MKKFNYLALSFLMFPLFCGNAIVPEGEPALVLKTTKGSRSTDSQKKVSIYLKNKDAEKEAYIDWGLGGDTDTIKMIKAQTLYSKTVMMTQPDASIRIWGEGLSFINCNTNDIYAIEVGESAKTITEFRCQTDSLRDFSFLNNLPGLTYLVCGANPVTQLAIASPTLERLDMGNLKQLEKLTLDCPKLYEFKLAYALIDTLDFRKCPDLTTVSMTNNLELEKVYIEEAPLLKTFTCSQSNMASFTLKNLPSLASVSMYSSSLQEIIFEDLPSLTTINISKDLLTKLELKELPSLSSVTCNDNPITYFSAVDCPKLARIYINNTLLTSLDLSACDALATLKANDCELKSVKFSSVALNQNLSSLDLRNNYLTISTLPAKPADMSASVNYYAPQREYIIPASFATGEAIDMNTHLVAHTADAEVKSSLTWITLFEEELKENEDYSLVDGVFTFLKPNADSVYCVVSNTVFPQFKGTNAYKTSKTFISVLDGLDSNRQQDSKIKITGKQVTVLSGVEAQSIMIFDITGKTVAKTVTNNDFTFTAEVPGVYMIRAGKRYVKVVLK